MSSLFFASCGEKSELGEVALSHPWDWVPEEPALASGQKIYLSECSLCHNEGEEGAPALTKSSEWAKRSEKGLEQMVKRAIEGFTGPSGEMPARGGSELSDEEVSQAVSYMVEAAKR